jgi:hypothetical protein
MGAERVYPDPAAPQPASPGWFSMRILGISCFHHGSAAALLLLGAPIIPTGRSAVAPFICTLF